MTYLIMPSCGCQTKPTVCQYLQASVSGSPVFLIKKIYDDGALWGVYLFLATDEEEGTTAVGKAGET